MYLCTYAHLYKEGEYSATDLHIVVSVCALLGYWPKSFDQRLDLREIQAGTVNLYVGDGLAAIGQIYGGESRLHEVCGSQLLTRIPRFTGSHDRDGSAKSLECAEDALAETIRRILTSEALALA